jgi:hypothetical protein
MKGNKHMKTITKFIYPALALFAFASISIAQSPPLFTADYFLSNPESYLGENVTLEVAYVRPRNQQREDGLQQLEAYTYNRAEHRAGGWISVLTDNARRVMTLCGTELQDNHTTLLHGVFSAEEKGDGRYYILVQ